MSESAVLND